MLIAHFNSIKVRLELDSVPYSSCIFDNFNSIKVRLEQKYSVCAIDNFKSISIP